MTGEGTKDMPRAGEAGIREDFSVSLDLGPSEPLKMAVGSDGREKLFFLIF